MNKVPHSSPNNDLKTEVSCSLGSFKPHSPPTPPEKKIEKLETPISILYGGYVHDSISDSSVFGFGKFEDLKKTMNLIVEYHKKINEIVESLNILNEYVKMKK